MDLFVTLVLNPKAPKHRPSPFDLGPLRVCGGVLGRLFGASTRIPKLKDRTLNSVGFRVSGCSPGLGAFALLDGPTQCGFMEFRGLPMETCILDKLLLQRYKGQVWNPFSAPAFTPRPNKPSPKTSGLF